MARKSEREFVGGDMSDEEFAALNGDTFDAPPAEDITTDAPVDGQSGQEAPVSADAPVEAPPQTDAKPEPQMVDIRAVQEARAEKRRLEEEFARYRAEEAERMARIDERIKLMNEALAPKPDAPKTPTLQDEPLDYIEHRFQTVDEKLAAFEKAQAERAEEARQSYERQAALNNADSILAVSMQKHPDIAEAVSYAGEGVKQEITRVLTERGVTGADFIAQANAMFQNELLRMAQSMPRDPDQAAEFIRRNARYWGWSYQPKQAEAAPAAQAAQVQQPVTPQQRAEQQQRHMSLSGVTGAEPPKVLDAVALGKMTDKEYRELLKTTAGRKAAEDAFGGY